jgi:sulfate transport system permease protein
MRDESVVIAPAPPPAANGVATRRVAWPPARAISRRPTSDPLAVRVGLTLAAVAVITVLIVVPVVNVFYEALRRGVGAYVEAIWSNADTRQAIGLTLTVAPAAVFLNTLFGLAAAWAIARFRFPGRTLLLSLIDLPFAVSPVVAGLVFVLLFGLQGVFGPWLQAHGIKVIFAWPGLVLATAFVTFPFVARELLPVMEAIGPDEELAAVSLGASGWQMFWRVTLPNIRWGLLYGLVLCNARAMGEFGAVYVVSGHIAGRTDTMPLRIEKLVQEYDTPAAFAIASLLTLLGLVTLVAKAYLEGRVHRQRLRAERESNEEAVPA